MDRTIEKVLKKDSPMIDQWKYFFDFQTHSNQFEHIFYATKFRRISVSRFRSLSKKIEHLYHLFVEGRIFTDNSTFVALTMKQIVEHFPQVELGGRWSPTSCYSRHHVNNFLLEICLFFQQSIDDFRW